MNKIKEKILEKIGILKQPELGLVEATMNLTLAEVWEEVEKCGQVSGNAIRKNVVSNGKEYYIRVQELLNKIGGEND